MITILANVKGVLPNPVAITPDLQDLEATLPFYTTWIKSEMLVFAWTQGQEQTPVSIWWDYDHPGHNFTGVAKPDNNSFGSFTLSAGIGIVPTTILANLSANSCLAFQNVLMC